MVGTMATQNLWKKDENHLTLDPSPHPMRRGSFAGIGWRAFGPEYSSQSCSHASGAGGISGEIVPDCLISGQGQGLDGAVGAGDG